MNSMMKILIITNISVLRFYGYIKYIGDISMDILTQNIDQVKNNKILRQTLKNYIRSKKYIFYFYFYF